MSESDGWGDRLTAAERVRAVAETVSEPRTANWIAEEAGVAHGTATKYLEQLVEDGRLLTETAGERTSYRPDPVGQYLVEMRDLYEQHEPDELAHRLEEMNADIRGWKQEYGVESPNELRASIGDADETGGERRRIAREWERLAYRRRVVEDALRLHDRFPEERQPTTA